ncbi:amino acid ABC transporter permease [Nitrospina watsonii]|uniref:Amino-acid permease protein YxeN n=1 Tax=Nitrospina watsonii TaxID=1323948 RepID=A0ABM9HAF4_9BACT|nr:amino acid ABC transporter permease [Nitrospina watsonii]CAI2717085.1 putative amino-acid permease protein YxeN [Nitrospina watsonii]
MDSARQQSGAVSKLAWNLVVAASFILLIYLPAEDALMGRAVPGSYLGLMQLLPIGIAYTLGVTLAGSLAAILVGLIVSFGKLSGKRPLQLAASLYTEALRGIPLLVFLFYIYYALGEVFQVPKLLAAILGFGFSYGAYMADVFRAGIEAVPKEQGEAARSLGMNAQQAMFQIILPQAWRTIIPAIGNQTLGMLKDTSLVSVLAISDILRVANQYAATHFNYFETYTYVALTYLLLTLLFSKVVDLLERRVAIH